MRMRKKKNRTARFAKVQSLFAVDDGEKLDLKESFGEKRPLWLEIGCGKGAFAAQTAVLHPEINYLAVEKVADVLLMAMEKAMRAGAGNLRFRNCDASGLAELLKGEKAQRIYINFCDPWPKKKNAKRRLTSPLFLELYKGLLADGARIYFKTDNDALFDYSLEQFKDCGYKVENVCRDLHASPLNEDNVCTEYERSFSEKGVPIKYLEASAET